MAVLMQTTTNSRELLDEWLGFFLALSHQRDDATKVTRCHKLLSYDASRGSRESESSMRYKRRYFWDSITHSFKPLTRGPADAARDVAPSAPSEPSEPRMPEALPSSPPETLQLPSAPALPLRQAESQTGAQDSGILVWSWRSAKVSVKIPKPF